MLKCTFLFNTLQSSLIIHGKLYDLFINNIKKEFKKTSSPSITLHLIKADMGFRKYSY